MGQRQVNDRTREVDISEDREGRVLNVTLEDGAHSFRVLSTSPGRHHVEESGRGESLCTAPGTSGTWVWSRGRAFLVREVEQASRRSSRKAGQGGLVGGVTPPMPAVVTGILVEIGQQVDKGEELLIVTAMKMETRLVAGHSGTVSTINTEIGANVRPGDVLVEIEPPAKEDDNE